MRLDPRPFPLLLAAPLLLLLGSCSSEPDGPSLDDVRRALDAGQLERASELVAAVPPAEGDVARQRLERQVNEALEAREEHRARFDELLASIPDENQRAVLDGLRELEGRVAEASFREEIEVAMASLPDRYREARTAGATGRRPGTSTSGEPRGDATTSRADGGYPRTAASPDGARSTDTSTPRPGGRAVLPVPSDEPVVRRDAPRGAGDGGPAEPSRAETSDDAPASAFASDDPGQLRDAARLAQREGRLADAREAYLAAAEHTRRESMRQDDLLEAHALEDRLALRAELAERFAAAPGQFPGVDAVDGTGVTRNGTVIVWQSLSAADWIAVAQPVELSARAALGLVRERLLANDVRGAFAELRRLEVAERVAATDVGSIVARHRGEAMPREGYAWSGDRYVSRAELRAAEHAERIAELVREFTLAKPGDAPREVWETLVSEGGEGDLLVALDRRTERVVERLAKTKAVERLERLEEARRALDAAREAALALIFDETEYFYPYNPPDCPPERAKEYPAVQRRVDELVDVVRDAWRQDASTTFDERTRAALDELAWLRDEHAALDVEAPWPADLPASLLAQDRTLGTIDLASFAWTPDEAAELARSRRVRALNEELWGEELERGDPDLLAASQAEQRQVRITNDYRAMFGRRALVWDPRLQRAARDHSDYMSRTGDFGHFEPDPETHSPFDRMKRRGYDRGVSENCHMGGGDPMGAHVGWCGSSGHHRNLLGAGHREMASAQAGPYWTQNYGTGRSHDDRLK